MLSVPYSLRHYQVSCSDRRWLPMMRNNTNNSVHASDEMIFIGRTSGCVAT